MNKNKKKKDFGIFLIFTAIVFFALFINSIIVGATVFMMVQAEVISFSPGMLPSARRLIIFNAALSVPIGILVSFIATKVPFKPIRNLIDGMNRLASGDFKTRIKSDSVMGRNPAVAEVTESFNKMAEQLENTEMLRSDFINNFSHEFKTPIVSIAGFAKLLKKGNLSAEQQKEYIGIIEEESLRLSAMATNVLNLTKIENQTILTEVSEYNLSEQIRSCVLLLENKWSKKDIELSIDFGEHKIRANEELLKQVWINLLDNAIKFTPNGHTVEIRISEKENEVFVSVMNTGSEIPPEQQEKVFNKFYQADESHSGNGNGIGLAIVKSITELHGGKVSLHSENCITVFTVELPKER